eukprot:m.43753 g.43753  ORF g.43753 m.43753 type:complete len:466 (+) comp10819_c0_seq2:902-2299(+)
MMANDDEVARLLARLEEQNRLILQEKSKFLSIATAEESKEASASATATVSGRSSASGATANAPADSGAAAGPAHTGGKTTPSEWEVWSDIVSNWDVYYKKKAKRLSEMIHAGVPTFVRGIVWPLLARSKEFPPETNVALLPEQAVSYAELLQQPTTYEKYILRDLPRTYPHHEYFAEGKEGQQVLYNVIKAYSNYDSEVGYCQGSPFIVGALLVHMPEEEAFALFCTIMRQYGLRGLFKPSMADLPLRLFQVRGMVESLFPALGLHFTDIGIEPASFAAPMFLTLFGPVLPLPLVYRAIDVFLLEGLSGIFRFALAILGDNLDRLVRSSFEDAMRLLSGRALQERYESEEAQARLMVTVARISVPAKKLASLEKEFRAHKAREDEARSEMAALREANTRLEMENKALRERVTTLEMESALLARRLVDAQSRLHQSEDHVDDLLEEKRSASRASLVSGSLPPPDPK